MFRSGSQCGLKPSDVLDMSLDVLQAVMAGYADRLFDNQLLAVQVGQWAGYYNNAKRPKSADVLCSEMIRSRNKAKNGTKNPESTKTDVNVEAFLELEKRRLALQQH